MTTGREFAIIIGIDQRCETLIELPAETEVTVVGAAEPFLTIRSGTVWQRCLRQICSTDVRHPTILIQTVDVICMHQLFSPAMPELQPVDTAEPLRCPI